MFTQQICKFSDKCRNKHVTIVCDDENCKIDSCEKRHPKQFRFQRDFGRCKFAKCCSFDHRKHKDIRDMNDVIEELKKKIETIEKNPKKSDVKTIDLGEAVDKKIEAFENQLKTIRKTMEEKDVIISDTEKRLTDLENRYKANNDTMENKIKSLETSLKKHEKNIDSLTQRFVKTDAVVKNKDKRTFKCQECDLITSSEQGLKTHNTRKHNADIKKKEQLQFPRTCELCDYEFDNVRDMKQHMKTHCVSVTLVGQIK